MAVDGVAVAAVMALVAGVEVGGSGSAVAAEEGGGGGAASEGWASAVSGRALAP